MKVFLSGATGFIAESLIPELQRRGHWVSGLVRYVSTRDQHEVAKMLPGVEVFFGDMTDPESLDRALTKAQPDVIMNLAAQTSVEYSFTHLKEIYQVDFLGLTNLTTSAYKHVPGLKRFVHVSSVETYGNQTEFPLREDMKLNPAAPYGVAKASGEYHMAYMRQAFGFPSVVLRNANSYGRRRNKNFVVEHIIQGLLSDSPKVKMGNPDAERDFYYIDDEVDFFRRAIEHDEAAGETINSGTGQPVSIKELYRMIGETLGVEKPASWGLNSPRANEIRKLSMDVSKAKRVLGWEPKVSLEEGLRKTCDYWEKQGLLVETQH